MPRQGRRGKQISESGLAARSRDHELVSRALAGDREAFGVLYAVYRNWSLAIAHRFVERPPDMEDVIHDSFLKALERLAEFKSLSFMAWITAIVRHSAIDFLRRDRVREREPLDHPSHPRRRAYPYMGVETSAEQRVSAAETIEAMQVALQQISANNAEVFILRVVEDLPFDEIGARLGIEPSTANVRYFRALRDLRKKLTADRIPE